MRILVTADWYLPGFKAGGPIRSLSSLATVLGNDIKFDLVTRDRDLGDSAPYSGVPCNQWVTRPECRVNYRSPRGLHLLPIWRFLAKQQVDVLYVNSLFSRPFSMWPLLAARLGLLPKSAIILAPRGELSPGALSLKRARKRIYLLFARACGLYRDVTWHASTEFEAADIRRVFGVENENHRAIVVASDTMPIIVCGNLHEEGELNGRVAPPKAPGYLSCVFLSRVSPMKNLEGALSILRELQGRVDFHVYGPAADEPYIEKCRAIAATLPSHIKVFFRGPVAPDDVPQALRMHHLFFLPTLGENYGHAIVEAMNAGLPVLISNCTPWRGLAARSAGADFPLEDRAAFIQYLQEMVWMDSSRYTPLAEGARVLGREISDQEMVIGKYQELFAAAAARRAIA
jgi:glycosyltransferase involved in cell wall biosynthesis